jgi:hypothetical protein
VTVRISSIGGNPTPEEVVAITAAVTTLAEHEQEAAAAAAESHAPAPSDWLSVWVEASRRAAQRSSLSRGPWRISGRIARRSRV